MLRNYGQYHDRNEVMLTENFKHQLYIKLLINLDTLLQSSGISKKWKRLLKKIQ